MAEYLRAGLLLIYVVYPRQRFILAYESLANIRGFAGADTLDAEPVVAGFKLPLTDLFPRGSGSATNGSSA